VRNSAASFGLEEASRKLFGTRQNIGLADRVPRGCCVGGLQTGHFSLNTGHPGGIKRACAGFSRNSLVTLNEINITPLLDLAFVLLIIFIIVSGSIRVEEGIDLKLPQGGKAERKVNPKDVRTVSVTQQGIYFLGNRQMRLDAVVRELVTEKRLNPNLVVDVRVDELGLNKDSWAVVDRLSQNSITDFRIRTRGEK
jgi:biopolymer transport protein ExbD